MSADEDHAIDEWKEARSIMARLDGNLHDLRKYGFSFVTALLTANALLGQVKGTVIPTTAKLMVFVVTLGLIIALNLLDRDYTLFEKATSLRAVILEKRLNLNITDTIRVFYDRQAWWKFILLLYIIFIGLTTALGYYALSQGASPSQADANYMIVAGTIAFVIVALIQILDLAKGGDWSKDRKTLVDWDLDRKTVTAGSPVRITLTNLSKKTLTLEANSPSLWRIESRTGDVKGGSGPTRDRDLGYLESYDWLWPTQAMDPNLYDLKVSLVGRKVAKVDADSKLEFKAIATIQVLPAKSETEPDMTVKLVDSEEHGKPIPGTQKAQPSG